MPVIPFLYLFAFKYIVEAQENNRYGKPVITFLEGLNQGVTRVGNHFEKAPILRSPLFRKFGNLASGEVFRAAERTVQAANDAADAARPVLKGTIALRNRLQFLQHGLDAVEAAGTAIRKERESSILNLNTTTIQ